MVTFSHRVALKGEYDLARLHEIAALFNSLGDDGAILIDLTEVTYLDSTVLKELARLRLQDESRVIQLAGANSNIRRLFKIVGFEEVFDIA